MAQIYNDMTELVREFPVKNNAWMALDSCFVAEASSLGIPPGGSLADAKDPWNRSFVKDPEPQYSEDNEIVAWNLWTSVNRQPIKCKVFND
jgi:hypothetical protein